MIEFKRRDNKSEFLADLEFDTTDPASAWRLFCASVRDNSVEQDGWTCSEVGVDKRFVARLQYGNQPSGMPNWKVEITCDFPYHFVTVYTYVPGKPAEWDLFGIATDGGEGDLSSRSNNGKVFDLITSVIGNKQDAIDSIQRGIEVAQKGPKFNDEEQTALKTENRDLKTQLSSMQEQLAALMKMQARVMEQQNNTPKRSSNKSK
jgi:hypothetical protein